MQPSAPAGNESAGLPTDPDKRTGSPELDHVGVLVRDLPSAVAAWADRFDVGVARRIEVPDLDLSAVFRLYAANLGRDPLIRGAP